MGNVERDLSSRRGTIQGMEALADALIAAGVGK